MGIENECPACGCGLSERQSCFRGDGNNIIHYFCDSEHYKGEFSQTNQCRITQLTQAIKHVVTQWGDDLCWMDLKNLAELVGVEFDGPVGDKPAMLKNCERFVDKVCLAGGPWPTYAELVSMLFKCGRHAPDCNSRSLGEGHDPDERDCNCGWAEIRDKLWPVGAK